MEPESANQTPDLFLRLCKICFCFLGAVCIYRYRQKTSPKFRSIMFTFIYQKWTLRHNHGSRHRYNTRSGLNEYQKKFKKTSHRYINTQRDNAISLRENEPLKKSQVDDEGICHIEVVFVKKIGCQKNDQSGYIKISNYRGRLYRYANAFWKMGFARRKQ